MNWEKLFTSKILQRGLNYYENYLVEDLIISEDSVSATVIGTDDYFVDISLKNGEVIDMQCSCPYAEEGNNCKHMAAVLYAWEDELENGSYSTDKKKQKQRQSFYIFSYCFKLQQKAR